MPRPRPFVSELPVYSAAPDSQVPITFRASSNESGFAPSQAVVAAAIAAITRGHRYPVINASDLIEAIAGAVGATPGMIAVADGALSLLHSILLTYLPPGGNVVYAWRSYEAYPICVVVAGGTVREVPLTDDYRHDLDAMARSIDERTAAVILCNPNNPTGTAFGKAELTAFLDAVPMSTLVIYDEAYRDFVDSTRIDPVDSLPLIGQYPNLVALRTFSKVDALAGLRVGYLIADERVAGAIRKVQAPFPVSAPAVAAAIAALGGNDFRGRVVEVVREERERVTEVLREAGLNPVPSHGNFVWLPLGDEAVAFAQRLREQGIAIRAYPGDGARVSVGERGIADALARLGLELLRV